MILFTAKYSLDVNVWSHQSVLHKYALRSSAVRPTTTNGGATIVRTNNAPPMHPQRTPKRFNNAASVILTAFAERTRNITEILKNNYIIYRLLINFIY